MPKRRTISVSVCLKLVLRRFNLDRITLAVVHTHPLSIGLIVATNWLVFKVEPPQTY